MSERGERTDEHCGARTDPVDVQALADACTNRARAVVAAVRRLEDLTPDGDDALWDDPVPSRHDRRVMVLGMFRAAVHPSGYALLAGAGGGAATRTELARLSGLGPVPLWEAVADLIQVGLLERATQTDGVRLTPAGWAVLNLVERVVECGDGP